MKKNNQRGFVLAEAFIVSTFVLGVLVFMFLQIKTIINGYDKSFSYNTIPGIYNTKEIEKFIKKNNYELLINEVDEKGYIVLNSSNINYSDIFTVSNVKTLIISKSDLVELKKNNNLSQKFLNYIKTLGIKSGNYQYIVEFNDDTFVSIGA